MECLLHMICTLKTQIYFASGELFLIYYCCYAGFYFHPFSSKKKGNCLLLTIPLTKLSKTHPSRETILSWILCRMCSLSLSLYVIDLNAIIICYRSLHLRSWNNVTNAVGNVTYSGWASACPGINMRYVYVSLKSVPY